MSRFDSSVHVSGRAIVADKDGQLWLIDSNLGEVRPVKVQATPVVDPLEKTDGQAQV